MGYAFSKDKRRRRSQQKGRGRENFHGHGLDPVIASLYIQEGERRRNSFPILLNKLNWKKKTHQFRGWSWMVPRDPARAVGAMLPSISEFSADDFEQFSLMRKPESGN